MKSHEENSILISDDSSIYEVDTECMNRKKSGEQDCNKEDDDK